MLAGVGAESLHISVLLARQARAAGADGVVIPPPVTTRPSRRELARYFSAIAAAGELPAMVQDAPEFLGIELGPELVVELARSNPGSSCVKIEAGPERIAEWVAGAAGELAVFGGNAGLYPARHARPGRRRHRAGSRRRRRADGDLPAVAKR